MVERKHTLYDLFFQNFRMSIVATSLYNCQHQSKIGVMSLPQLSMSAVGSGVMFLLELEGWGGGGGGV